MINLSKFFCLFLSLPFLILGANANADTQTFSTEYLYELGGDGGISNSMAGQAPVRLFDEKLGILNGVKVDITANILGNILFANVFSSNDEVINNFNVQSNLYFYSYDQFVNGRIPHTDRISVSANLYSDTVLKPRADNGNGYVDDLILPITSYISSTASYNLPPSPEWTLPVNGNVSRSRPYDNLIEFGVSSEITRNDNPYYDSSLLFVSLRPLNVYGTYSVTYDYTPIVATVQEPEEYATLLIGLLFVGSAARRKLYV